MIKVPVGFQDFREFRELDKNLFAGPVLQYVQANGTLRVRRLDNDQLGAQVGAPPDFLLRNAPEQERRGIAMQIKRQKPAIRVYILTGEVPQEKRLAPPGFPKDGQMFRAFRLWDGDAPSDDSLINDLCAQIKAVPGHSRRCRSREAVPRARYEFFKK